MIEFLAKLYPISQLFWYRILFMAELIIAEALFTYRLQHKSYFVLRVTGGIAASFAFAFIIPLLQFNAVYCSVMFLVMFIFTILMLKLCYAENWKNIIFCAIAAYTTQHIAYEFYELTYIMFKFNGGIPIAVYGNGAKLDFFKDPVSQLSYYWGHAIIYWAMFVVFGNRIKRDERIELKNLSILVLVVLIVIVDIIISSFVTYYSYDDYNEAYMILLCIYNISCCLFALYIQFELLLRKKLEIDLNMEKRLRRMEEEQYILSKENIELINLKCHDLKHQIHEIGVSSLDAETLNEIENAVCIYDSAIQTGNKALDTILTEKSLLCNKNGIRLTCTANGNNLGFINDTDLYSLFGNIVDNAVEAVMLLDKEKRVIDLSVKSQGKMQVIKVSNYYVGELVFEQGLPLSTKDKNGYHGFGMKSIRQIVERYGGELSIEADGMVFNLKATFFS